MSPDDAADPNLARSLDAQLLLYFDHAWESEHLTTIEVERSARSVHFALPAADGARHVGELVDHWLGPEALTDGDLMCGIEILIDGERWADGYRMDFGEVVGWFWALNDVVRGSGLRRRECCLGSEHIYVLERRGEMLTMWDSYGMSRHLGCRVSVAVDPFLDVMGAAGRTLRRLIDAVLADLDRRGWRREDLLWRAQELVEGRKETRLALGEPEDKAAWLAMTCVHARDLLDRHAGRLLD